MKEIEKLTIPNEKGQYYKNIIVGVIENGEKKINIFGNKENEISESSIFEIGSITKTFTGKIFADLDKNGIIKVDDLAQNHTKIKLPRINNKNITIRDLLTHTSGINSNPFIEQSPQDESNPWACFDYSNLTIHIEKSIHSEKGHFEYNNIGFGILQNILEHTLEDTYENIVRKTIINPLGLRSTFINETNKEIQANYVKGFLEFQEAPHWNFKSEAAAGAIISNINDMLIYLENQMQNHDFDHSHTALFTMPEHPSVSIGYAILIKDNNTYWHNGGTYGFSSFMGFNKEKNKGIVILTNQSWMNVPEIDQLITVRGLDFLK